jgi:hypothetical protein
LIKNKKKKEKRNKIGAWGIECGYVLRTRNNGWAEHVACVGQKINGHKVLVGRAERRKRLERRRLRFVNTKRDLRMRTCKLD